MKILRFEDILSWQKAQDLALIVYQLFRVNKDYAFRDQLQRAVVSISNNIAEGYERRSNNELRQFLYIAKGSCGEVRSMFYLARELKYISDKDFQELYQQTTEISKLLSGLIKTL